MLKHAHIMKWEETIEYIIKRYFTILNIQKKTYLHTDCRMKQLKQ